MLNKDVLKDIYLEILNENQDIAMSDKKQIDGWIKEVDNGIAIWLKDNKTETVNVTYVKIGTIDRLSINNINNYSITVVLESGYKGVDMKFYPIPNNGYYKDNYKATIIIGAKFNKHLLKKNTVTYDYTTLYDQLQYVIDKHKKSFELK